MPLRTHLLKMAFLPLLFAFTSCVKDIDMDQFHEIVIPPEAAIDLIYFTLEPGDLFPGTGGELRATDETRLDFLDDDYIQTSLMRADFNFRFINSFESPVTAILEFRSENDNVQYQIPVDIPAGDGTTPAVIDFTEIIDQSQIQKIRRSIKLSVEIVVHNGAQANAGELQLKSRGFYYFEFK